MVKAWGGTIVLALAMMLATTGVASADVQICNKTSYSTLSMAVVGNVTTPYRTKVAAGWWNIDSGTCKVVLEGNYTGDTVYYFAYFGNIDNLWIEDRDYAPVCVPADASKFTRYGSARDLQPPCPSGYIARNFYAIEVDAPTFTINLVAG